MPPLEVAIPVIPRSEQGDRRMASNPRHKGRPVPKPRTYEDGPLPVKPSDSSPKQARIIDRDEDSYHLRIGDIDLRHIGIEEVLDYVSQLDLEEFENRQFVEERSVLDILEAERAQLKREKLERQKQRAKTKGTVLEEEEVDSAEETTEGGEVPIGKHGRARPTYTHLFKRPNQPRAQKREFDSDDEISLNDGENGGVSAENEPAQKATIQPAISVSDLTKRRRRKRDKVTGELLPLSPTERKFNNSKMTTEGKRSRRKRHPLTGELMPLGWRYDPADEEDTYEKPRDGAGAPLFRHLSISEGPVVKRQRLDVTSSISRSPSPLPTKAQLAAQHTPAKMSLPSKSQVQQTSKEVHNLISSDDESEVDVTSTTPRNVKPPPKPMTTTPRAVQSALMHSAELSSTQESSPEPTEKTSISQRSAIKSQASQTTERGKTSIMRPSYRTASSVEPSDNQYESDDASENSDLDEDEWFIEAILGHQWSDPDTHPAEFGKEPVMLYLVKWEGYEEPSYEPISSFGDRSIVTAYHKQVGLDPESSEDESKDDTSVTARAPQVVQSVEEQPPPNKAGRAEESQDDEDPDDEDPDDEEEFEIENILDHRLSDPKTHPASLGRHPVVLYQVKWRGYEVPTWEPADSFEDKAVLQHYHTASSRGR